MSEEKTKGIQPDVNPDSSDSGGVLNFANHHLSDLADLPKDTTASTLDLSFLSLSLSSFHS